MSEVYLKKKTNESILLNPIVIEESGEGYIRFSDGTQICYGRFWNVSNSSIINYPKPFISDPALTLTRDFTSEGIQSGTCAALWYPTEYNGDRTSHFTIEGDTTLFSENTSLYGTYIAIGRWK